MVFYDLRRTMANGLLTPIQGQVASQRWRRRCIWLREGCNYLLVGIGRKNSREDGSVASKKATYLVRKT